MHLNSNKVPTENKFAMGEATYNFIDMLKPFNFMNVHSNMPPHVWTTTKAQHMCTILIKWEW